ncbi:MAG: hypothetical protein KY464_02015 [Gemmatimonadetes bacterium]|nr:hypothetical protein [Gemmatimonadota bacterium]
MTRTVRRRLARLEGRRAPEAQQRELLRRLIDGEPLAELEDMKLTVRMVRSVLEDYPGEEPDDAR